MITSISDIGMSQQSCIHSQCWCSAAVLQVISCNVGLQYGQGMLSFVEKDLTPRRKVRCHWRPHDFSSVPILICTQMSIAEPHLYGWTPTFCPWRREGIPHRASTGDWDAVILCLVVGKADTRVKKRVTKRNRVVRVSWIDFVLGVTITVPIIFTTVVAGGAWIRAQEIKGVISSD